MLDFSPADVDWSRHPHRWIHLTPRWSARTVLAVPGRLPVIVLWVTCVLLAAVGPTAAAPAKQDPPAPPTASPAAVAPAAQATAAPGGAGQAPPSALDWVVKSSKAVQELISGVLSSIGWALVVLVVLLVLRRQLVQLLQSVTAAMEDRGVTLDVASVKVQVSERLHDIPDDRPAWFSRTPLEIDDDAAADRPSILSQLEPQLVFQVTDSVAGHWSKRDAGAAVRAMRGARATLAAACDQAEAVAAVKTALTAFAQRLEATRFLEAKHFADLFDRHPWLGDWLNLAEPKDLTRDGADLLILHCAGVGYAQKSEWTRANALLDKIAWKERAPFYLPAADTWLACAYHAYVAKTRAKTPDLDLDSAPDFFSDVEQLLAQGRQLLDAMRQAEWSVFAIAGVNVGYYQREVQKVLATILSILGEYATAPASGSYFTRAHEMFRRCVEPIDGDDPAPLDYNNLADLYRQEGDWVMAHAFIDRAFDTAELPDPIFCHTRALIFAKQQQPARALRALDPYGADDARREGGANAEQYLDNQILAAKLTFSLDPCGRTSYAGLAARILEDARRFVDEEGGRLGTDVVAKLRVDFDELLGFAYLQIPGFEDRAVEAFDRLPPGGPSASVAAWRRRLGRVRALTRLARAQRRNFSSQVAAQYWKRAHAELIDAEAQVKPFGLESTVPAPRRVRHLRLRLDTVVALRLVAEEGSAEGERQTARAILDQETPILVSLRTALQGDAEVRERLGEEVAALLKQVQICEARRSFLLGRILAWSDPSFNDAGLIAKVEANFDAARGAQTDLDCLIDFELGEMLLTATIAGKGDVNALYRQALSALERAAASDVSALRAEAVKILVDAYARRGAILRKAKASAKSA